MFREWNAKGWRYWSILGALLLALIARTPGVFWGSNFPMGWYGHHIDEYTHLGIAEALINPKLPPHSTHVYPKGLGAHVALPIMALEGIRRQPFDPLPTPAKIVTAGRAVSVLYGVATVLVTFLFAVRLFRDERVAHLSAWIMALGGLHVSQSHFFVSDVPSLFWFLLGLYFLFREMESPAEGNWVFLSAAAVSLGISLGLKINVFGLPTLAFVVLRLRPRIKRLIQSTVFYTAGFVVVNLGSYSLYEIYKTLAASLTDPLYHQNWVWSGVLYVIELPSIISFPMTGLFAAGTLLLLRKLIALRSQEQILSILLTVILPILVTLYFVLKLDHFARQIIPLLPWVAMVVAWSLTRMIDRLAQVRFRARFVLVPFFLYLALFVFDGEKGYLLEPRNLAARWILQNVPQGTMISWIYHTRISQYKFAEYPIESPPVVVMEMHYANHYLSGQGLRNSFPTDRNAIFDAPSIEYVRGIQALFKGETDYREVARYGEGYFMPEYVWTDNLVGNRSRNYLAEIVIFAKTPGASTDIWDSGTYED